MIKIKLDLMLTGKTSNKNQLDLLTNSEKLERVLGVIKNHFGDRPVHVLDGNLVLEDNTKYPDFFAAGWFIGEALIETGKNSELVVVGHGNSFISANNYLMYSVKNIDWNGLAKNV